MAAEFICLINNGSGKKLVNQSDICNEILILKTHDTLIEIRVYTNKTVNIANEYKMSKICLTGQQGIYTLIFDA